MIIDKTGIVLACVFGLGPVPLSYAATTQACPTQLYGRGVDTLAHSRANWSTLQRHQRRFDRCDDGELAEGYSDAVVGLFSNKWETFGQFIAIARTHADFFHWAVKHIDVSASESSLVKVTTNASPCAHNPSLSQFCMPILDAVQGALKALKPAKRVQVRTQLRALNSLYAVDGVSGTLQCVSRLWASISGPAHPANPAGRAGRGPRPRHIPSTPGW